MKLNDLTGQSFGRWTVLRRGENKGKATGWLCRCACGNERNLFGYALSHGQTESCGCLSAHRTGERSLVDLTGRTFERWTVLHRSANKGIRVAWRCRCECGNERDVTGLGLTSGDSKSCGCLKRERSSRLRTRDLTGQVFGRLTVLRRSSTAAHARVQWECACACGRTKVAQSSLLLNGHTQSCGCLGEETRGQSNRTHGATRGGHTPEYRAWTHARQRCENPRDARFPRYGGRGIAVCERWWSFENFLADMGPRPSSSHSIDRIDNDGNYEPGNCRWATKKQQARNKRNSRVIEYAGRSMPVAAWAEAVGVPSNVIECRLCRGWELGRVFAQPIRRSRRIPEPVDMTARIRAAGARTPPHDDPPCTQPAVR